MVSWNQALTGFEVSAIWTSLAVFPGVASSASAFNAASSFLHSWSPFLKLLTAENLNTVLGNLSSVKEENSIWVYQLIS